MCENLGHPQISQGGVILNPPSVPIVSPSPTKISPLSQILSLLTKSGKPKRFRHWEVTFYDMGPNFTQLLGFRVMKEAKYVMNAEICPDTGRPHYQAHISLKNAIDMDTAKTFFFNQHKSPTKCLKSAVDYCGKPETRDFSRKRLINGYQDMEDVNENIIDTAGPLPWQKYVIDLCLEVPDRRTIHWLWSTFGYIGKSDLVAWLVDNMNGVSVDKGKGNDIRCAVSTYLSGGKLKSTTHAKKLNVFILDLPKEAKNNCDYSVLEAVKNGRMFSGKYEPVPVKFRSPHVFVFANYPPKYEKCSQDRWNVLHLPSEPRQPRKFPVPDFMNCTNVMGRAAPNPCNTNVASAPTDVLIQSDEGLCDFVINL